MIILSEKLKVFMTRKFTCLFICFDTQYNQFNVSHSLRSSFKSIRGLLHQLERISANVFRRSKCNSTMAESANSSHSLGNCLAADRCLTLCWHHNPLCITHGMLQDRRKITTPIDLQR